MLTWNETLSVGVNKIDSQHKELFAKINDLLIAMKNGSGKDEVLKTLDFLETYVIKHFDDEEELQKKNNYPKYEIQHAQHEQFKNELKELRKTFETTGISALFVINTQQKISKWWITHIGNLDKELGEFLQPKTLK
jgi:hemerythrin